MISVKNLYKSFGSQHILKGVSLEVEKGERVVIVGPSGGGKSTVLRCMNRLVEPSYGEVWLDDKAVTPIDPYMHGDIIKRSKTYQKQYQKHLSGGIGDIKAEELAVAEIIQKRLLKKHEGKQFKSALNAKNGQSCMDINLARRKMVMVFQHFNLFKNMTVLKNLTYAPVKLKLLTEEEAVKKAEALLERIGLPDKKNDYPISLSGGQQQRVAIARSLMVNPEVILFDEPTSALDPIMVGEVLNLVKELASDGLTMVIVTHEMGFAREVASKMVFISDGRIIESAPPAEFFDSPKTEELKEFLSKVL